MHVYRSLSIFETGGEKTSRWICDQAEAPLNKTTYVHRIVTREARIVFYDKLFVVKGQSSRWLGIQNRIRIKIKIWIFNAIRVVGEKTIFVFRSFPLYRDMDTVILFTVAFNYFHSFFLVFYNTHPSAWCPSHCAFKFSTVYPRKSYLTKRKLEFLKKNFKHLKHKIIYNIL